MAFLKSAVAIKAAVAVVAAGLVGFAAYEASTGNLPFLAPEPSDDASPASAEGEPGMGDSLGGGTGDVALDGNATGNHSVWSSKRPAGTLGGSTAGTKPGTGGAGAGDQGGAATNGSGGLETPDGEGGAEDDPLEGVLPDELPPEPDLPEPDLPTGDLPLP